MISPLYLPISPYASPGSRSSSRRKRRATSPTIACLATRRPTSRPDATWRWGMVSYYPLHVGRGSRAWGSAPRTSSALATATPAEVTSEQLARALYILSSRVTCPSRRYMPANNLSFARRSTQRPSNTLWLCLWSFTHRRYHTPHTVTPLCLTIIYIIITVTTCGPCSHRLWHRALYGFV